MEKLATFELDQIVLGDARKLGEKIPDSSIDLIFTDPVYWKLEDYDWLGKLALRVLKEGSSIIVQAGSEYRLKAEMILSACGLVNRPLIAELFPFAFTQMFKHKALQKWKPYLWFSKGADRSGGWIFDGMAGTGRVKTYHPWQDPKGIFIEYISRLTEKGGIVLDPFSGSGTVAVAAKLLHRRYLSFEIEEEAHAASVKRLALVQPYMVLPEPQQLELNFPAEEEAPERKKHETEKQRTDKQEEETTTAKDESFCL